MVMEVQVVPLHVKASTPPCKVSSSDTCDRCGQPTRAFSKPSLRKREINTTAHIVAGEALERRFTVVEVAE